MGTYAIQIDDKVLQQKIGEILNEVLLRELANRYSISGQVMSEGIKELIYSRKDEIIDMVVTRRRRRLRERRCRNCWKGWRTMELKNCPFCGGEAQTECLSTVNNTDGLSKNFVIRCKKCGLRSPQPFRIYARIEKDGTCEFDDAQKIEAFEFWNRRANDGT